MVDGAPGHRVAIPDDASWIRTLIRDRPGPPDMRAPSPDLRAGVTDMAPLLVGLAPFGLVVGVAMVSSGLSVVQALSMSVLVYGGASQLAVADLLTRDAPFVIVAVTALAVNLRFAMLSASIASYFERLPTAWRWLVGVLLVDVLYALSVTTFEREADVDRRWYYLGAGVVLWLGWQAGTVLGVALGTDLPESVPFEFVVPLIFIGLLVPALEDASTLLAAAVGGFVAVAGANLPLNAGLLVAAGCGIAAGLLTDRRAA
jgi:4-azaleucine resistance transporter AzlC